MMNIIASMIGKSMLISTQPLDERKFTNSVILPSLVGAQPAPSPAAPHLCDK